MLASSKDEAEALAAQDPHQVRGIRTMEVLEWNPHARRSIWKSLRWEKR